MQCTVGRKGKTMGLFNELKKLTRPYSSEEYDEFGDEYAEIPAEPRTPAPAPAPAPVSEQRHYAAPPTERRNPFSDYDAVPRSVPSRRDKVVNLGSPQPQLISVKPVAFAEAAAEIADHIREHRSVILNLEETEKSEARRILDFVSGAAYVLDGKVRRVSEKSYIVAPNNVDVSGDFMNDGENAGIYIH